MRHTAILSPRAAALERIKALVLDTLPFAESKRAYRQALDDFFHWCEAEAAGAFTKATVNAYRASLEARGLSPSTINQRLSAIRKLAVEAADNGFMPPELAAAISRVKGAKRSGIRTGQWLTREQAENLISSPNAATMKGKRDRALLAMLVGCGLRRREATALSIEHIQLRDARWVIVDLIGKGGRIRTVPMPSWTKNAIDAWTTAAGIANGLIFRSVNRGGLVRGMSMTPRSIFEVVQGSGLRIGVPNLAPHDLRRTFAKLAHKGRAALEQIQLSLGHASVTTTERYLGVRQDLTDAPCDHLGLTVEVPR
jgi:site-specific recombinase XerD